MTIAELRKDLKTKKPIFGADKAIKGLKTGNIEKVYLSKTCKEEYRKDIERYCKLSDVTVISLKEGGDEIGAICKKPFVISIISFAK